MLTTGWANTRCHGQEMCSVGKSVFVIANEFQVRLVNQLRRLQRVRGFVSRAQPFEQLAYGTCHANRSTSLRLRLHYNDRDEG
jgi:hypothetical protein